MAFFGHQLYKIAHLNCEEPLKLLEWVQIMPLSMHKGVKLLSLEGWKFILLKALAHAQGEGVCM